VTFRLSARAGASAHKPWSLHTHHASHDELQGIEATGLAGRRSELEESLAVVEERSLGL
jgi:hypothetical protein